jgi:hypothetical protein
MSDGAQINGTDPDGMAEREPEVRQAGSRRWLLGAAAGGFGLAASGLVLPDWLIEEAEADNHPVRRIQKRKAQRRKKHRTGLEHRREVQRRQDDGQDKGRGGVIFDGIWFDVTNYWGTTITVEFWVQATDETFKKEPTITINNGRSDSFLTGEAEAFLWIDHRYLVYAKNPWVGYVYSEMAKGGSVGPRGWTRGSDGNIVTSGEVPPVTGGLSMHVEGHHIKLTRNTDEPKHKRLGVIVYRDS